MLAPFFNKHNLTPRVNSFFGFEGAGKARDDYMKRMIMDRDGAFEDPLRERAMPVEKLEVEVVEDERGEVNISYALDSGSRVESATPRMEAQNSREETASTATNNDGEMGGGKEEEIGASKESNREGAGKGEESGEVAQIESRKVEAAAAAATTTTTTTYSEMHSRILKERQAQVEKMMRRGGSYGLQFIWRQEQTEKRRREKAASRNSDVLESRDSRAKMEGFATSLKRNDIHRDRRVFGEFPGAGCMSNCGSNWEEGLNEQRGRSGEGAGLDGSGRKTLSSSRGLCAIVKVKKPRRRPYMPGIVRVKVKQRGKKKLLTCDIDTRAELWEVCEGIRRISKVSARQVTLHSRALGKEITAPRDIFDGDVVIIDSEINAVSSENLPGGSFSSLAREPMAYMRSISPENFGPPQSLEKDSDKEREGGKSSVASEDAQGVGDGSITKTKTKTTMKKKKKKKKTLRKRRKKENNTAIEYDENGHKVVAARNFGRKSKLCSESSQVAAANILGLKSSNASSSSTRAAKLLSAFRRTRGGGSSELSWSQIGPPNASSPAVPLVQVNLMNMEG